MSAEFLFDIAQSSRDEIIDQLMEAAEHIPGLVFSYPPISAWQPVGELRPSAEELWAGSEIFSHNLYIHIPFCRQKCSFCYYSVAVVQNDTEVIWEYLRCLEREAISYLAVRPGWRIETVFIGGGTPNGSDDVRHETIFTLDGVVNLCRLPRNVISIEKIDE